MGWNEWPLIIFTVLAQTAVGAFMLSALAIFLPGKAEMKLRFERHLLPIWVLLGIGFLCSMAHLGMPMRGANAFLRFGQAALSNEIAFGTSFMACGGIAWLLSLPDKAPGLRKALYAVAVVLGLCFLWNMTSFYMMPTVPTWNTPLTPLAFATTALIGGVVLVNFLFALSGFNMAKVNRVMGALALFGLLAAIVVTLVLMATLPSINTSAHQAALLSLAMGWLEAFRFVLLALAMLISFRFVSGRTAMVPAAFAGMVFVVAAEMIGRGVFFALHMTVGVV